MVQPPVFRKVPFIFHGFIMFFPDSGSIAIESRKAKAKLLLENNPGKIPIMMVKSKSSSVTLSKESLSEKITISGLIYYIRKSMRLPKTEGLYLYISDRLPPLSMILYQLYQRSADEDGFLYIYYTSQEDKGCCII